MQYRKLTSGTVQLGDRFGYSAETCATDDKSPDLERILGREVTDWDGRDVGWYRPVTHHWIRYAARKPAGTDANQKDGQIAIRYNNGTTNVIAWNAHITGVISPVENTMWMPLNFVEPEPVRIKVDGHEVIPNKDGSMKIGCQTVPAQDMDEIIRQRTEAMQ